MDDEEWWSLIDEIWLIEGEFRSYLSEVEGCAVATIVVVPVHVKDLLAVDG